MRQRSWVRLRSRVLGELDIINAYERIRAYYLNCVETLAGGKR